MQESIVMIHCISPKSSSWMDYLHSGLRACRTRAFFFHSFMVKVIPGRKRDAEKVIMRSNTRVHLIKIMQRRHDITKPNQAEHSLRIQSPRAVFA